MAYPLTLPAVNYNHYELNVSGCVGARKNCGIRDVPRMTRHDNCFHTDKAEGINVS